MKRALKWISIVVLVLLVIIQFVPVDRENPTGGKPFEAPAAVLAITQRACFDCHSNETKWPWYAYVAPLSWLVEHDVEEGREHLNLSLFGDMSEQKRSAKADEMYEETESGEMPPSQYLLMHGEAKLSPKDIEVLRTWAEGL
ncbi:MAG: heme-binding domain-containing protein [Planctomycetota bacterium]|nr:heme-binding domain-containing protein [Planctomycetota bacterium]